MTIRSIPCYEVACDAEGCDVKTGHISDFSGWGDWGYAVDHWVDHDGQQVGKVNHGYELTDKHYCHSHRIPECCGCDATTDLTEHEGDHYCPKCLAEEARLALATTHSNGAKS